MPGYIPATGQEIAFGKVNRAYTNYARGSAGNAPTGGQNIALSSVLASQAAYGSLQAAGTQVGISARFGGRYYPYDYL